jgi:hypothetical protein
MKQILLALACACILSSCCTQRVATIPGNQPKLNEVVSVIQDQYKGALDSLKKLKITKTVITEAELSLKVTKTISADAEFSVLIFKPKASRSQERSTTVTYKLTDDKNLLGGDKINKLKKDNSLRDAIVSAAVSFHSLNTTIGTLTKESFSLDLVFSIENQVGLGLGFEVWGVGADLGGSYTNAIEHELVLTFKSAK